MILGGADKRQRVFREAGATIARARIEKSFPDARIEANPFGYALNIRAHNFAQFGHFIDVGEFERQERIGGIFGQFAGAAIDIEGGEPFLLKRRVYLGHDGLCLIMLHPDDNPVRLHKVFNGNASRKNSGLDTM